MSPRSSTVAGAGDEKKGTHPSTGDDPESHPGDPINVFGGVRGFCCGLLVMCDSCGAILHCLGGEPEAEWENHLEVAHR